MSPERKTRIEIKAFKFLLEIRSAFKLYCFSLYIFLHPIHHRAPAQLNHYQADKYWEKRWRYSVDRDLFTWIALFAFLTAGASFSYFLSFSPYVCKPVNIHLEIFEDKKASDHYDEFHCQRHKYMTMNELLRQYERLTG